jgi:hypothetical protein
MNTINQVLAIAFVAGLSTLQGVSQTPIEKIEVRRDTLSAQRIWSQAKIDSATDYIQFKNIADQQLRENRASITLLKEKKHSTSQTEQNTYANSVNKLELKNQQLEKKIKESATTRTAQWTAFKFEFNHDMEELGKSIKDMGTKYPK